jgi:hypothetical protein
VRVPGPSASGGLSARHEQEPVGARLHIRERPVPRMFYVWHMTRRPAKFAAAVLRRELVRLAEVRHLLRDVGERRVRCACALSGRSRVLTKACLCYRQLDGSWDRDLDFVELKLQCDRP